MTGAVAGSVTSAILRIGESDCERLRDGLLAQPANALSSLAYTVVGLAVAAVAARTGHERTRSFVFAACLIATGLGSVAFHGPQPAGARFLHDYPILLTVLFMAAHDVGLLFPQLHRSWATFVVGGLAAVALTAASPEAAAALTGVLVVGVVAAEVLVYRRRLRPVSPVRQRRTYVVMGGIAAVAGALWVFGRTDSPLCDPGDLVQPHGLWHVASATLFGLWWWLALGQAPSTSPLRAETRPG